MDTITIMSFLSELRTQLRTSIPSILCMLLYKVPWLISLSFVGSIGSKELAAAALATTLCNVTGMSLSVGLSSAITTLTGQARGELISRGEDIIRRRMSQGEENSDDGTKKETVSMQNETTPLKTRIQNDDVDDTSSMPLLPLVYLYRGIFIQLAFVIPVGCYWLYGIKPLLLYLGQKDEISTMTEQYLRILSK